MRRQSCRVLFNVAVICAIHKDTERVDNAVRSRKLPPEIQDKALRLLREMARVRDWNDLRYPPGNRLHALGGDRAGHYAIWINRQRRIAFTPVDGMLNVPRAA